MLLSSSLLAGGWLSALLLVDWSLSSCCMPLPGRSYDSAGDCIQEVISAATQEKMTTQIRTFMDFIIFLQLWPLMRRQ